MKHLLFGAEPDAKRLQRPLHSDADDEDQRGAVLAHALATVLPLGPRKNLAQRLVWSRKRLGTALLSLKTMRKRGVSQVSERLQLLLCDLSGWTSSSMVVLWPGAHCG